MRMSNKNVDTTAPVPADAGQTDSSQPESENLPLKVKPRRTRWILLGILGVLLLTIAGSAIGYGLAIQKRIAAQEEERYVAATTQYELALVDQKNGKLATARNRLEYVLTIYPEFPGADQKLAEILTAIATSSQPVVVTPTPVPITPVPIVDTGAVEDLFKNAQAQYANQEWDNLIVTVHAIRDVDPTYEAMKVDDMFYAALRNAGINQIKQGNLEVGLYDFSQAEQMGPIDQDAESYRTWATMYITGASWWGLNWEKVIIYFSQLNNMVPDMIDYSGMSVRMRYADALTNWGDQLVATGDFCGAVQKYEASNQVTNSQSIIDKLNQARSDCENNPTTPTPNP